MQNILSMRSSFCDQSCTSSIIGGERAHIHIFVSKLIVFMVCQHDYILSPKIIHVAMPHCGLMLDLLHRQKYHVNLFTPKTDNNQTNVLV